MSSPKKSSKQYKALVVRMEKERHDELFAFAKARECPVSVVVREAIRAKIIPGYQPILSAAK